MLRHHSEVAKPALLLRFKSGATCILTDPEEIAAVINVIQNRPRGFAATYAGLEVVGYKYENDLNWTPV